MKDFIDVAQKFKYELPSYQQDLQFDDLLHLTYLSESQSEHPLAQAIVRHVKEKKSTFGGDYVLHEFKNINGEGITAKIQVFKGQTLEPNPKPSGEFRVVCGNERLMERFNVNLDTNNFRANL